MLERISAFVLEVLPCVLTMVIAAALIPAFVYSQIHGTNGAAMPSLSAVIEKVEFTPHQLDERPNAPQSTLPYR